MRGANRRFELRNRVVLITGAAGGIGRALALAWARQGAELELVDLDERALSEVASAAEREGARSVRTSRTDVSVAAEVDALARAVHQRSSAVDVLINNAGVAVAGGLLDCELDDVRWVLGVNLWGVLHTVRAFAPAMIAHGRGGRIINVASIAGLVNMAAFTVYGVSKYGVVGLSEALREELAPHGIGVSVVCPGFVDTDLPLRARIRGSRYREQDRARIRELYRRYGGPPEQVAEAVLRAARDNEAVVPVSAMARALYLLKRWSPSWVPHIIRFASGTGQTTR